ncbi:MAG: YdeI/OmpD-associated family protein [Candidatus Aenigmarchaeota archaeon]|nr:YdeI/OmpD-associated family protein [Candidatus Aenigmarchaeota archaeon]
MQNTLYLKDRHEWRAWLEKNHSTAKEAWVVFYKKHTGKKGAPYLDVLEEALCFGWIDGPLKRIDDEKHAIKFTPRRKHSVWAESNIERAKRMIRLGKMTPAGLEKFKGHESRKVPKVIPMPEDLENALKKNRKAWENFQKFAPSHRKHYFWWIISSKKPETRERRIKEVVNRAAINRKLVWERVAEKYRK